MKSNQIIKLQKCIIDLRDDIVDILHATSLNHSSLLLQINSVYKGTTQKTNDYLNTMPNLLSHYQKIDSRLKILSLNFQSRSENHLNYLIVKQIQEEQISVRKDRLMDYQDKIYDLRRLISDKQTFLQSLLRPKKKRPQNMQQDEFHQMRAKQKASEQLKKIQIMNRQKKQLEELRRLLEMPKGSTQLNLNYQKCKNLESTKTSSIENPYNITGITINETCLQQPLGQGGISQLSIPMCRRHSTNEIPKQKIKIQNSKDVSIFASMRRGQNKQEAIQKINKVKGLLDEINKVKSDSALINLQRINTQKQSIEASKQLLKYQKLYREKFKTLKSLHCKKNESNQHNQKRFTDRIDDCRILV